MERQGIHTDADSSVTHFIAEESYYHHAAMVARITEIMTQALDWETGAVQLARDAALLHDIGKNFVPQEILNKPGKLTSEEYAIVKTHADLGFEYLISQIKVLFLAAILSLQHHERIDGSGYAGMKDKEIQPIAKLVAVVDVFEALYSQRPYKKPWSSQRVKEKLQESRGKLLEPKYVDLIFACLDDILVLYEDEAEQENYD